MLYVGVDHHTKTSHLTVVDESGEVIRRKGISSSVDDVREALQDFNEPIKAVLEAGYNWGKMYDWLDEVVDEVLVRIGTMLKNRMHALIHQYDLQKPNVTDIFGAAGTIWLRSLALPDPDASILEEDLLLLGEVSERIASTEGLIKELSKGDQAVRWLKSIPGIGDFFSVLIRYEVGDMARFRSAGKFAAYTGLIPSTYASGERLYHGKITKQGNRYLRWAFIEAVTPATRVSPELRAFHERIARKNGKKAARVATARKLAEIVWHVWTEQRFYEVR